MRKVTTLACLLALLPGCTQLKEKTAITTDDRFQVVADEFVASHYDARPIEGVGLGWHQYDGRFVVPDQKTIASERDRLRRFGQTLASWPAKDLTPANRYDLALL